MATVTLIPRTVYNGSSSYLTISNSDNMLTNVSSTTYGTVTCTRSSTSSYYVYLRNFDFTLVPDGAIVSNITIKVKGYHSGGNTSTLYMYSGTGTQVSACGSGTAFTTSASTITFSNTTIDWETLKNYGSDLGIRINCRRSSRNTSNTIYIYGAEIDVTYTLPTYYTITSSNSTSGTISPSGSTSIVEGNSYTLTISGVSSPTVTDNGVNVSSQLVQQTSGTETLIPDGNTISGFSSSNISNAYTDASSTTSATLTLAGRTTGTLYLDLGGAIIPSSATIQSVSCSATLQFSRNNSSSSVTASFQLYTGSTAKGSATSWISSATDVSKTTYNLTTGTWTAAEIANARFYLTAYNGASSTQRQFYVYGVSFNVTYEFAGIVYTYTINSVTGDHTIIVGGGSTPVTPKLYAKINGTWTQFSKAYKKINGSWVEQTDLTSVFNTTTNYRKGN